MNEQKQAAGNAAKSAPAADSKQTEVKAPTLQEQIVTAEKELAEATAAVNALKAGKIPVPQVLEDSVTSFTAKLAALKNRLKTEAAKVEVEKLLQSAAAKLTGTIDNGSDILLLVKVSKDAEGKLTTIVSAKGEKIISASGGGRSSGNGVEVNGTKYASAAEACRALGIEVGAASAVSILERKAKNNELTFVKL